MTMKVNAYRQLPAAPAWQALFEHCAAANYFSSRDWYENFIDTVVIHDEPLVFLVAEDEHGDAAAVLPLWSPRRRDLPTVRRLDALGNYYTCLYEPLLCAEQTRASAGLAAIVAHLANQKVDWSILELRPLPIDAWYLPVLTGAFARHGLAVETSRAFGNWYLDSPSLRFDAYFASRSNQLRRAVRSKTKKVSEQFQLEMVIVQDPAQVDGAYAEYLEVYESSWKHSEPYPQFIPRLMGRLARQGQLRLGILRLNGRAAAAQLWFVDNGIAYIYKLAYDPAFAQYSVGNLLTMKCMEHVLDVDQVHCVDFLSGDDEYKEQWMSARRDRIALEVVNHRSLGGSLLRLRKKLGQLRRRFTSTR